MSSPRSRWRRPPRRCAASSRPSAAPAGRVDVTFNYRYAPTAARIKELLPAGAIGEVVSVDFHWYLDVEHGADYFRRWHAYERFSGSLFVHKATHHFDLLNWYLASEPEEVFARGDLRYLRPQRPVPRPALQAAARMRGECDFHIDIGRDPWLDMLYEEPSRVDGYVRDACVFREDIDIPDTMNASIRYRERGAGLLFAQHLHADRGPSPRLQRHEGPHRDPPVRAPALGNAGLRRDPG